MFGKGEGWRSLARWGFVFILLAALNLSQHDYSTVYVCWCVCVAIVGFVLFFIAIECNDQEEGLAHVLRLDGVSK